MPGGNEVNSFSCNCSTTRDVVTEKSCSILLMWFCDKSMVLKEPAQENVFAGTCLIKFADKSISCVSQSFATKAGTSVNKLELRSRNESFGSCRADKDIFFKRLLLLISVQNKI